MNTPNTAKVTLFSDYNVNSLLRFQAKQRFRGIKCL